MTSIDIPQDLHAVQITLHGDDNLTYVGNLILDPILPKYMEKDGYSQTVVNTNNTAMKEYDQVGASYFVIAVILVYVMS